MLDTLRANPLPATEQIVAPKAKEGPDTVDPIGIILENPSPIKTQAQGPSNLDTLFAMENEDEEGMDAEDNADMFLNLDNIEDVEMSTDSSKRKRDEEGEECSCYT